MNSYETSNEPVTNKPRVLNIEALNINVTFSKTLKNDDGSIIMEGKSENLYIGQFQSNAQSTVEELLKADLAEKIELLVVDYLNSL